MRSPCISVREMIKRQKTMTSSVLMYSTAGYFNEIPPPKKKRSGRSLLYYPRMEIFKGIKPKPQSCHTTLFRTAFFLSCVDMVICFSVFP